MKRGPYYFPDAPEYDPCVELSQLRSDLAAQTEATEDIQLLGGTEALDKPYFTVGFWNMVRKRGGWLAVLFIGEMLTATAMGFFLNRHGDDIT